MKKTALVTGGSGDIGSEICIQLANKGYNVAICYNQTQENALRLAEKINAAGGAAQAFHCDISSVDSVKSCIARVLKAYGEPSLLVNNAGISDINLFTDISENRLCQLIDVNLTGAMRVSREALAYMIRNHEGNIINISSVWGECGASCEVAYSAAKAGLIGFTKALAREVAPSNVRVNCVSCGLINTKMNSELSQEELNAVVDQIGAGRMGTALDVANAVCFLADEKSSYIQGQVIRVDGCWI